MSDVTRILRAIEQGDAKAADELLPLVYEELRRLAAQKMSQEPPGQTIQATNNLEDQMKHHTITFVLTFAVLCNNA